MVDDYKSKTMTAIGEVLKAYTDDKISGPFNVAYSGGKDSTVTLAIVMRSLLMIPPRTMDAEDLYHIGSNISRPDYG